mmetsp:Transcript_40850/g.85299  ORF Transcript_40850/g.85299 Transcript_40850/m.85299 type:complete len:229 (-) Transcript_40850:204-890(-)
MAQPSQPAEIASKSRPLAGSCPWGSCRRPAGPQDRSLLPCPTQLPPWTRTMQGSKSKAAAAGDLPRPYSRHPCHWRRRRLQRRRRCIATAPPQREAQQPTSAPRQRLRPPAVAAMAVAAVAAMAAAAASATFRHHSPTRPAHPFAAAASSASAAPAAPAADGGDDGCGGGVATDAPGLGPPLDTCSRRGGGLATSSAHTAGLETAATARRRRLRRRLRRCCPQHDPLS